MGRKWRVLQQPVGDVSARPAAAQVRAAWGMRAGRAACARRRGSAQNKSCPVPQLGGAGRPGSRLRFPVQRCRRQWPHRAGRAANGRMGRTCATPTPGLTDTWPAFRDGAFPVKHGFERTPGPARIVVHEPRRLRRWHLSGRGHDAFGGGSVPVRRRNDAGCVRRRVPASVRGQPRAAVPAVRVSRTAVSRRPAAGGIVLPAWHGSGHGSGARPAAPLARRPAWPHCARTRADRKDTSDG